MHKNMCYICFHLYLWIFFRNATLDQATTGNGFSSQNQIKTRYYIGYFYFLEPYVC